MSTQIPLWNRGKEIVAYALVDEADDFGTNADPQILASRVNEFLAQHDVKVGV